MLTHSSRLSPPAAALHAPLARWAAVQPDAPFTIDLHSGETLSYAACLRAVATLRAWLGPEPRTIVAALPPGNPAAVLWLAALTGGHLLAPLPPDATDDEKARLARTLSPDVLVVPQPADAQAFACSHARVLTPPFGRQSPATSLPLASPVLTPTSGDWSLAAPRDGTLRLTTSGTTGSPKGIRLDAARIAWTADQIRRQHQLTSADRGLCVLPFFHVNAPVVSLCATLFAGGTLAIAPRFSNRRFWAWTAEQRVTWASIVPAIVALLLQTDPPDWLPGQLRFVRTASAPLPVVQLRAFERRFGIPVVETYGLTEAASTVAANPVPPARARPGSVGLPVGVQVRICRPQDDGAPTGLVDVVPGEEGEICVAGPGVIQGYEGEADPGAFQDGWFRTGDQGYRDPDGYLYITGRLRDLINRGGHKIAPREIEELLLEHPGVADAAVVGRPHPIQGEEPVAYVVPERPDPGLQAALMALAARRLSAYKQPVAYYFVAALPRATNGKLQRRRVASVDALPAEPAQRYA